MSNKSNQHGRALEFAIVQEICARLTGKVVLTQRANDSQAKDSLHYALLSQKMQNDFLVCSQTIYNWLEQEFTLSQTNQVNIDRFPDLSGTQGNVSDIHIKLDLAREINLSIKHRNIALKHQRPKTTPQHCGYSRDSQQSRAFYTEYERIAARFAQQTSGRTKFNELPENIKSNYLYQPICQLITEFINSYCQSQTNAEHLFRFLTGTTDYYKIHFDGNKRTINIVEFANLPPVKSVLAKTEKQYIYLDFSNEWCISMRLHNASRRITKNPSLKFDTQPKTMSVSETIIKI
ncbi:hypothetical protein C7H19_23570 [Aphanothece hegewaldii CCALA 016]|uniref:HaeIII family restriction endonuclease n=1 Tax=Aphanothece hegewaldii CCALA 016 TaxID=2107694 RepID=A0A2T1LR72_9CHRO|nr:HaeIII family restriction endonuclease [Aphanothece hegewaldii]PSF30602.1 hypothetical protein C7H19_23570 [Aphanothece hegewaldii CCALA 016]